MEEIRNKSLKKKASESLLPILITHTRSGADQPGRCSIALEQYSARMAYPNSNLQLNQQSNTFFSSPGLTRL
jgi:hypothetical protein